MKRFVCGVLLVATTCLAAPKKATPAKEDPKERKPQILVPPTFSGNLSSPDAVTREYPAPPDFMEIIGKPGPHKWAETQPGFDPNAGGAPSLGFVPDRNVVIGFGPEKMRV